MAGQTIAASGTGEWMDLRRGVSYRIDVFATTWDAGAVVKLETASASGGAFTVKKSSDDTTDWEAAGENNGTMLEGPGRVRPVVTDIGTTTGLTVTVNPQQC